MPTPIRWQVPIELTPEEARVAALLHRTGKFYVFLRRVRAELFDDAFQAELAAVYQPRGTAPLPGAWGAMVTLLQAYTQMSDADAVIAAQVDRRWQLVLGCLGATKAPFSQGALVKFRERMIAHDFDSMPKTRRSQKAAFRPSGKSAGSHRDISRRWEHESLRDATSPGPTCTTSIASPSCRRTSRASGGVIPVLRWASGFAKSALPIPGAKSSASSKTCTTTACT
jgi:hypothetical protein